MTTNYYPLWYFIWNSHHRENQFVIDKFQILQVYKNEFSIVVILEYKLKWNILHKFYTWTGPHWFSKLITDAEIHLNF